MHEHVAAFIESVSEAFSLEGPIYEFGYVDSADSIGGPIVESGFPRKGYLACQEGEPAQVDRLEDLMRLPFPDGAARTVISVNTLEHVFEPRRAVEEMDRILAPGGVLLIASASSARSPERPHCYWQPTPAAIQRLLAGFDATLVGWQGADHCTHTLFGIAAKAPVAETFVAGVGRFLDRFQKRLSEAAGQLSWWQKLGRLLMRCVLARARGSGQPTGGKMAGRSQPIDRQLPSPAAGDFHKAQFVLHLPVPEQLKHQLLASCLPEEDTGTRLDTSR